MYPRSKAKQYAKSYDKGVSEFLTGVKDVWLKSGMGLLNPNNPAVRYLSEPGQGSKSKELEALESLSLDPGGLMRGIIKVYHGGAKLFDKWDFKKALSGEGATMYGHGAYLAENPKVGQSYQQQLASKLGLEDTYKGKPLTEAYDKFYGPYSSQLDLEKASVIEDLGFGKLYSEVLELVKNRYKEDPNRLNKSLLNWVEKDVSKNYKSGGYLYEMDLKHRPRDYLQHDVTLGEQSEGVKKKLKKMSDKGLFKKDIESVNPKYTFGSDIYWDLMRANDNLHAGRVKASELLSENKIPGIRYKDQGSRMEIDKPTYNYVVFPTDDPDIIKIKGLLQ